MNKFQIKDKKGQNKAIEQLVKILSGATLNIEQHYIDKATVDIMITATTKNCERYYAIEAKDREYNSSKYNDWFLELHKKNELLKKYGYGYTPLYLNTFPDNKIIIWDLSKIDWDKIKIEKKYLPVTTVENRGNVLKDVYLLPQDIAVYNKDFI